VRSIICETPSESKHPDPLSNYPPFLLGSALEDVIAACPSLECAAPLNGSLTIRHQGSSFWSGLL
jgi:hypothetical protein